MFLSDDYRSFVVVGYVVFIVCLLNVCLLLVFLRWGCVYGLLAWVFVTYLFDLCCFLFNVYKVSLGGVYLYLPTLCVELVGWFMVY